MHCFIHWKKEFIPAILVIKKFLSLNTTQFAEAIISNFGKIPTQGAKPLLPNMPVTPTYFKLEKNPLIVTEEMEQEKIVGVDFFIESIEQPEYIADKCQRHAGEKFKLISISNRGTQVWPTGSVYTNLVNQYNVRFESMDESAASSTGYNGIICKPQWRF